MLAKHALLSSLSLLTPRRSPRTPYLSPSLSPPLISLSSSLPHLISLSPSTENGDLVSQYTDSLESQHAFAKEAIDTVFPSNIRFVFVCVSVCISEGLGPAISIFETLLKNIYSLQ